MELLTGKSVRNSLVKFENWSDDLSLSTMSGL